MRGTVRSAAALVACSLLAGSDAAAQVFFVDVNNRTVFRSELDGSGLVDIVALPSTTVPFGIAVDAAAGRIYWSDDDFGFSRIMRASLDGSGAVPIVTENVPFFTGASGLAVDPVGGKIYIGAPGQSELLRANLDGSNLELVADGGGFSMSVWDVSLDLENGKVTWSSLELGIQRANLDGSGKEDLFVPPNPKGVHVDPVGGKVYWVDDVNFEIRRANLDGSGMETLAFEGFPPFVGAPEGLWLDLANGKVYWTSQTNIVRANLDGSGIEEVVAITTGFPFLRDVEVLSDPLVGYSLGQTSTSATAGNFPSSPPIQTTLLAAGPLSPPVLGVDAVIALATADCGTPAEVDASMTASAPVPDRLRLDVTAAAPAAACTDDLSLTFEMLPPDPIAPAPTVAVDFVELAADGSRFDVFATVTQDDGTVQDLRLSGQVGSGQPSGAVTITNVVASIGSLDLDVELTTTGSFDPGEPALELDLRGFAPKVPGNQVPALGGPLVALVAALLVATAAWRLRAVHDGVRA